LKTNGFRVFCVQKSEAEKAVLFLITHFPSFPEP